MGIGELDTPLLNASASMLVYFDTGSHDGPPGTGLTIELPASFLSVSMGYTVLTCMPPSSPLLPRLSPLKLGNRKYHLLVVDFSDAFAVFSELHVANPIHLGEP